MWACFDSACMPEIPPILKWNEAAMGGGEVAANQSRDNSTVSQFRDLGEGAVFYRLSMYISCCFFSTHFHIVLAGLFTSARVISRVCISLGRRDLKSWWYGKKWQLVALAGQLRGKGWTVSLPWLLASWPSRLFGKAGYFGTPHLQSKTGALLALLVKAATVYRFWCELM